MRKTNSAKDAPRIVPPVAHLQNEHRQAGAPDTHHRENREHDLARNAQVYPEGQAASEVKQAQNLSATTCGPTAKRISGLTG
jgi:hypothetical protein